jgi:hypothetical protein
MIRNTVYQVRVDNRGWWSRVWIDRKHRKVHTMYDTSPEHAATVRASLPTGGILEEYEGGFMWMLPNFGRE